MSNAPEPFRDRDFFGWVVFGGHLRVGMYGKTPPLGSPNWEKAAAPGTPCDIADTFLCSMCNEECEVRSKVSWSAVKLCCRLCRNNYKRQNERCNGDKQLKTWWVQLSDEEREEWFRKNKAQQRKRGRGNALDFDNRGYEQAHSKDKHHSDEAVQRWMTYSDFFKEEGLVFFLQGVPPAEVQARVEKLWEERLSDRTWLKRTEGEQTFIGKFAGYEERTGSTEAMGQAFKRHKSLKTAEDHEDAERSEKAFDADSKQWSGQHMHHIRNLMSASSSQAPSVAASLIRGPAAFSGSTPELAADMKHDTHVAMQVDAMLEESEANDKHDASNTAKVAGEASGHRGAGRPPKTQTELLTEAQGLIRDKCNSIDDSVAGLKASLAATLALATATFPEGLPAQVQEVTGTLKTDVEELLASIAQAKDGFGRLSLKQLVTDAGTSKGLKEQLAGKLSQVFKVDLPKATKAVTSCKKAIENAGRKHNKKNKTTSADTIDKSILSQPLQQLLAITDNIMSSSVNIELYVPNESAALEKANIFRVDLEILHKVIAAPGVKSQLKWADGHVLKLYKDVNQTHGMCEFKQKTLKTLTPLLQTVFPKYMKKPKAPSDSADLMAEVFDPQCFSGVAVHCHVGATPYGVGDVRVLVSGSFVVAGMPTSLVGGDTLRDKIDKCLTSAGCKTFLTRCKDEAAKEGFIHTLESPGDAIIIPPDFFIMLVGIADDMKNSFNGIRFGYVDGESTQGVDAALQSLDGILGSFPALVGGEYTEVQRLCTMWKAVMK